jgi:hypothetical protein
MFALTRAGFAVAIAAALFAVAPFPSHAADKPFVDSDLADSAVQLEGQIKSDAGAATKPVAQIRKDADSAFAKNDFRTGMTLLGQIVATQPNDATTWLRMARTVMQIRPVNDQERATLLERASTAAYIAYVRTTNRNEEADSLAFLGDVMSRRSTRCGFRSTSARPPMCAASTSGCATSTASACSTTRSMPILRRRARASSFRKICRRVPISRRSSCSPAPTSRRSRPPKNSSASKV